jgi:hypothetical protein
MEAIAGVSAVTAVVQFGFSIATAIHTYVGDYKDAPEDIASLALDIDAVTDEVEAISSLVSHDQTARDLDQANQRIAEKCVGDLNRSLTKLLQLLSSVGISNDGPRNGVLTAPDISRRMKLYWPRVKPKVEEVRRKLDSTRIQILLARLCLEYCVSPAAEKREQASLRIPGLYKLVKRQERADMVLPARTKEPSHLGTKGLDATAMRQRGGDASLSGRRPIRRTTKPVSDQGDGVSVTSHASENALRARENYLKGQKDMLQQFQDEEASSKLDAAQLKKIHDQVREEIRIAESQAEDEAARMKKLREDAVEEYKKKEEERRAQTEATRVRLEAIFKDSPKDQIDEFMQALSGQGMGLEMSGLAVSPSDFKGTASKDASAPVTAKKPTQKRVRFSPLSFWKKRPSVTSKSSSNSYLADRENVRSYVSDTSESSRNGRSVASSYSTASTTQPGIRFGHLVLSYHTDFINNDECAPFDGTEFPHYPCDAMCDFRTTMSVWARIPPGSKALAQNQLKKFFGALDWELHATVPIEPGTQAHRNLFHRNVFRSTPSPMYRGKHVVLVVFSALDKDAQASDQATESKRSSRSSNAPRVVEVREWLGNSKDPGERDLFDEEIEMKLERRRAGADDLGTETRRRPDDHTEPTPPPPPHLQRYRNRHDDEVSIREAPNLQLDEPNGSNSRTLVSRSDKNFLREGPSFRREGLRTREVTPDDTAIAGKDVHERPYVFSRQVERIRGRSRTRAHERSVSKISAEQRALNDSRGLKERLNILDFGSEYERRLQFPRHPDFPAHDFAVQSDDEPAKSTTEALDLALTLYTGGGVSKQEPPNMPEDEEKTSHTSEHDSADNGQTWPGADPEPVPGNLRVSYSPLPDRDVLTN